MQYLQSSYKNLTFRYFLFNKTILNNKLFSIIKKLIKKLIKKIIKLIKKYYSIITMSLGKKLDQYNINIGVQIQNLQQLLSIEGILL